MLQVRASQDRRQHLLQAVLRGPTYTQTTQVYTAWVLRSCHGEALCAEGFKIYVSSRFTATQLSSRLPRGFHLRMEPVLSTEACIKIYTTFTKHQRMRTSAERSINRTFNRQDMRCTLLLRTWEDFCKALHSKALICISRAVFLAGECNGPVMVCQCSFSGLVKTFAKLCIQRL